MAKTQRARQPVRRKKSGGSFMLGMFFGLVLGLAVALGVAFYLNRAQIPFLEKSKSGASEATPLSQGSSSLEGAPQTGAGTEKPKFDFYKILPGSGEAPATGQASQPGTPAAAAAGQPAAGTVVYYIQTGAFQKPDEADSQKAKLALLGLDSDIEQFEVPDKGTWYRVRLGPYTRIERINRVRQQLAQNGFTPSLIKAKRASAQRRN